MLLCRLQLNYYLLLRHCWRLLGPVPAASKCKSLFVSIVSILLPAMLEYYRLREIVTVYGFHLLGVGS